MPHNQEPQKWSWHYMSWYRSIFLAVKNETTEWYHFFWLLGFLMLHWQLQTSTSLIDDSSNLNKVMKLLLCEWYIVLIKLLGTVWLIHCCVVILVVGIIFYYVFMEHWLYLKKKGCKIWGPKNYGLLITTVM